MLCRRNVVVALFIFAAVLGLLSLTALNHRWTEVAAVQRDARLKGDSRFDRRPANGSESEQLPRADRTPLRQLTPSQAQRVERAVTELRSTLEDLEKRKAELVYDVRKEKLSKVGFRIREPTPDDVETAIEARDKHLKQLSDSPAEREAFLREAGYLWHKYLVYPADLRYKLVLLSVYDKDVFEPQVVLTVAYFKNENVSLPQNGTIALTEANHAKTTANWHLPDSRDRKRYGYLVDLSGASP